MVATEELGSDRAVLAKIEWDTARKNAIASARKMSNYGVHKQIANRILEPFMKVRTILTGTEFDNFFDLRLKEDTQPEMRLLAEEMKKEIDSQEPRIVSEGEWHIPFVGEEEDHLSHEEKLKVSVARCARVSYFSFDTEKRSTAEEDIALYDKLLDSRHMSPFEHQAMFAGDAVRSNNFVGWYQYRSMIGKNQ